MMGNRGNFWDLLEQSRLLVESDLALTMTRLKEALERVDLAVGPFR